jgi:hypothetical protein
MVFKPLSTPCVTTLRVVRHDAPMEKQSDSYARLFEAVSLLSAEYDGPSALAIGLGESAQTVTNWSTRGVSGPGAINCQRKFGISATWVLYGEGPPLVGDERPSQPLGLDTTRLSLMIECLEGALLDAKRQLDPSRKARILALLYADPGVGNTREAVQAALRVAFMAME